LRLYNLLLEGTVELAERDRPQLLSSELFLNLQIKELIRIYDSHLIRLLTSCFNEGFLLEGLGLIVRVHVRQSLVHLEDIIHLVFLLLFIPRVVTGLFLVSLHNVRFVEAI